MAVNSDAYELIDQPSDQQDSSSIDSSGKTEPDLQGNGSFDLVPLSQPVSKPVRKSAISAAQKSELPKQNQQGPLSWGDVGEGFVKNILPDTGEQLVAIGHAVMNPTQTISALGQLGTGIGSKIQGALGVQQNAQDKAKNEALLNAVANEYKDKYGSVEGVKRALATHPASVLTDLSTLIGGAGAGLKAAGAIGDVSSLGRAGEIASKAASLTDPVTLALKGAGKVAKLPVEAVRGIAAGTSGVSPYLQKVATEAGSTLDFAKRKAFHDFYSGKGNPADYISAAQDALRQAKSSDVQDYLAKKGSIGGSPDFNGIHQAINDARAQTQQFAGSNEFAKANAAIDNAESLVNDRYFSPDPNSKTMEGVDALKQAIWDLRDTHTNDVAQRHLGSIYNSVKQSLVNANPEYANLMDQYSLANKSIRDAQKYLSVGDSASATSALMKGIRASKTSSGEAMINKMAQYQPTLPFMLAGYASSPSTGGLLRSAIDLGLAGLAGYHINPYAAVATAAAGSPKIVGGANYAAGLIGMPAIQAAKALEKIPGKGKMAYYAGAVGQEAAPDQKPTNQEEDWKEADSTAGAGDFNSSFNWLINHEGENYATDSNGYGAKFGINEAAHPDVDVKNLTKSQAKDIYKNQYWDEIGGDDLNQKNPKLALAAFDMAATAGPQVAKRLLEQSQGDINKFLSLRQKFLDSINDEKLNKGSASVDQVRKSWNQRAQDVIGSASGGRIERKSGGRVDNVQPLVDELMRKFKQAKKVTDKTTEPLLDQPDDAIVKALKVAQDAI